MRITNKAPYGAHIQLTCANHPELGWSTKNIGSQNADRIFLARTLFFDPDGTSAHPECRCHMKDLRLSPAYSTMPDVEE